MSDNNDSCYNLTKSISLGFFITLYSILFISGAVLFYFKKKEEPKMYKELNSYLQEI